MVLLSSMAIPLLKPLSQLLVLLSLRFKVARRSGAVLYRSYHHLREWGMLEVYLFGILVSIFKLIDITDLSLDVGLACFVALLLTQIWLEMSMPAQQAWEALSDEYEPPQAP